MDGAVPSDDGARPIIQRCFRRGPSSIVWPLAVCMDHTVLARSCFCLLQDQKIHLKVHGTTNKTLVSMGLCTLQWIF